MITKTDNGSNTINCQAFVIVASVSAGTKQIAAWWKEQESQELDTKVFSGKSSPTVSRQLSCAELALARRTQTPP